LKNTTPNTNYQRYIVNLQTQSDYFITGLAVFPALKLPLNLADAEPDMATIAKHKIRNPKVIINVGGLKHEVPYSSCLQQILAL
jgi:hypothetical protein